MEDQIYDLLMISILHDLIRQNPRNCGSMVYIRSCRMYIINSGMGSYLLYKDLKYGPTFCIIVLQSAERGTYQGSIGSTAEGVLWGLGADSC